MVRVLALVTSSWWSTGPGPASANTVRGSGDQKERTMKRFIAMAVLAAALVLPGGGAVPLAGSGVAAAATCDRSVRGGTNLQSALNAAGQGKTVCLSGSFTGSGIRPLHGQTIIGGTLHGSSGDGFDLHAGDVTLRDVEVYGYPGRGVVCGPGAKIYGSYLHDNRRNGIGCTAGGGDWRIVISGNRIIHNGSQAWAYQGASGIKIMELSKPGHPLGSGAIIENNTVTGNIGNGIWFDRSSSAGIVRYNTVLGSTHKNIRCEKCGGPFEWYGNIAKDAGDENLSIRNSAYLHLWNNTTGGSLGLRISFVTKEARKIYPDLNPVDDGYKIKSIVVEDIGKISGGQQGCSLANVRCVR